MKQAKRAGLGAFDPGADARLEQEGPAAAKAVDLGKLFKTRPPGKRARQRREDRGNRGATKAQRRARSRALERKAHRRFELAVGLRQRPAAAVNGDIKAMFPGVSDQKGE